MAPRRTPRRPLDKAWEHCVRVVPGQDNQVKYNYCPRTMYGGINRLKHHLARAVCKDVVVCDGCHEEVTAKMYAALESIKEQNAKISRLRFETTRIGRSPMGSPGSCS